MQASLSDKPSGLKTPRVQHSVFIERFWSHHEDTRSRAGMGLATTSGYAYPDSWQIRWQNVSFVMSLHLPVSEETRINIDDCEWWAWVDLNHRPRPYQGRALAT